MSWSYRTAMFLSDLQYVLSFRDRRAVAENLRVVCPDAANLPAMTREVFRNFGRYLVEFFRMANVLDKQFIQERVHIKNLHHFKEAMARGRGAIIVTAHLGNWELGGLILSMLGFPSVAVALPHKERPVNRLFNQQRESRGIKVIPTHLAIRRCLETLKNNEIVAIVADRDFSMNGMMLDFFGRQAMIPKGAAVFSCKTGAAMVPCFLIRDGEEKFNLFIEEPIYPPPNQAHHIPEETLAALMKQHTAVIEKKIRAYPTQWLMFRPFWSNQPRQAEPETQAQEFVSDI